MRRATPYGGAAMCARAAGTALLLLPLLLACCRMGAAEEAPREGAADGEGVEPPVATARENSFITQHLAPEFSLDTSIFTPASELGVTYLMVPYVLYNISEGSRTQRNAAPQTGGGNFHVWLKVMSDPDSPDYVAVRGFFLFESVAAPVEARAEGSGRKYYVSPAELYGAPPRFLLQPVDLYGSPRGDSVELTQLRALTNDRPWWLEGELFNAPPVLQLSIGDGLRPAPFIPRVLDPVGKDAPLSFHIAIPPTQVPADDAVPALLRHIAHHRALGFSSWLVYVRERMQEALVSRRLLLQPALDGGVLQLVVWQGPLPFLPRPFDHADAPLAYNHALLTLTGRRAYVALVDYDEFLVLPEPSAGVDAAVRGCMGAAAVTCIARYDEAFCAGTPPRLCPTAMVAAEYRLGMAGADVGGEARTSRAGRSNCRGLARPEQVYAWHMSNGQLAPGVDETYRHNVDLDCAAWAVLAGLPPQAHSVSDMRLLALAGASNSAAGAEREAEEPGQGVGSVAREVAGTVGEAGAE